MKPAVKIKRSIKNALLASSALVVYSILGAEEGIARLAQAQIMYAPPPAPLYGVPPKPPTLYERIVSIPLVPIGVVVFAFLLIIFLFKKAIGKGEKNKTKSG